MAHTIESIVQGIEEILLVKPKALCFDMDNAEKSVVDTILKDQAVIYTRSGNEIIVAFEGADVFEVFKKIELSKKLLELSVVITARTDDGEQSFVVKENFKVSHQDIMSDAVREMDINSLLACLKKPQADWLLKAMKMKKNIVEKT